jgi:putative hydrolase of the HAD superfamily
MSPPSRADVSLRHKPESRMSARQVSDSPVRPPVQCIAFDAVGTIIRADPPAGEVYAAAARRHGSQRSAEDVMRRFRQAFVDSERSDCSVPGVAGLATSEAREFDRWRKIVSLVIDDIGEMAACFDELYEHFARPHAWCCYDDVAPVVEALEGAGLKMAIASNYDHRLHPVCDGLPPLDRISRRVVSAEVGWRKPHRRFYESLIDACGCRPEEILMVGDDFENDIAGARAAGLQAVFLNRRNPVAPGEISSLKELGLLLGVTM